jgi:hypothetical protein
MTRTTRVIALATAGYLAITVVMLAPIASYRHLDSALYGGDTRLNAWAIAWVDHAVLDGVSLFDANIFYPARNALAYTEHLIAIALLALPFYALTRNAALSYNVVWLLSYPACALAAFAIAWRVTKDAAASWIGGVIYAFCFYRMLHGHAHLQLLWSCWIPLSLLLLERWWREPTWPRMLALWTVVLLQILTSWYLAIMVLLADALLALWLSWRVPAHRSRWPAMTLQMCAAAASGALLLWPIASRYTFLVGLNGQSAADALASRLGWRDLFVPPLNTWLGQWLAGRGSSAPAWIWGEKTLYLGYGALALAVVGVSNGWWRTSRSIRSADRTLWPGYFLLILSLALMLAFGPSASAIATRSFDWTPFGLLTLVPGLSLFRVPARFVQLVTLAIAMLAASGAATLHERLGRTGRVLTMLLVPLMLGEWFLVDFPGGAPQAERIPPIYRQLARLPVKAVVSLPDYIGGPEWFAEADYEYYATAHWHPILNGYSRTEPRGYIQRMAVISTFPSPESAAMLRALGADYLVLHTKRYRENVEPKVAAARASRDFSLAASAGSDYLFRVLPPTP